MEVEVILKVLVLVIGFYMAWNIGANDVSNAMERLWAPAHLH